MGRLVFGYGSLVNRRTHGYATVQPARLHGWRRAWQPTTRREVAFLNAVPADGHVLSGLVLAVPAQAPELEARERAYARIEVAAHPLGGGGGPVPVSLFSIADTPAAHARRHVLLLSYIDVVAQGLLRVFGEDGLREFFEGTAGWQAPVLDDRAAPRYPRAQALSRAERVQVDRWLARVGARFGAG